MAYRAAGLCVACAKAERRAGRIDRWESQWRAHRDAARAQASVSAWLGVLRRVLRYLPGSTVEDELGLEAGTVRGWMERRQVPIERQADLVELARRAPHWRW